MTQTKKEIRATLEAAGLRPLKQHGQHFLIDGNLLRKLVAASGITRRDVVLEVGPGTGVLTDLLLEEAGHVVAVEIDRGLHEICLNRFASVGNLTLIHGDVLASKSRIDTPVIDAVVENRTRLGGRIMLVANLPYQVATPLLVDLLMGDLPVSPMCFTVQAEVADRLVAGPGGKDYGPVSVYVQAMARAERIARVPPSAFWPEPQVDSAMVRLELREDAGLPPAVRLRLAQITHECFNHRRKILRWTLTRALDDLACERITSDGRWDVSQRPEQLAVQQWIDLARFLAEETPA